ncbi:MAG: hypothetical protein WKF87_06795 [Chryseolinea sp.]
MTIEVKISDFIGKARTKVGILQTELLGEFDRRGYQSDRSQELSLMISETLDFVDLLFVDELTNKEASDLIDFFIVWLDLNVVIAANFIHYQMPIAGNVLVDGGNFPSSQDLAAEIAARIAGDQSLSSRVLILENNQIDPATIFPAGFFDNYVADYRVVFDDDVRLHTHANIDELDQIMEQDIVNLKTLDAHFASVGNPGGMHVTTEDRNRWDAIVDFEESGEAEVYDLGSPSTVPVGGMPAGTAMTGRTWQSLIEEIAVDYLAPSFSSFGISDLASTVEVGTNISGNRTFTWGTTNSGNVTPNTIAIRDVTTNTIIASALANDGNQVVDTGVIANVGPLVHSWRGEAQNTILATFVSGNRSVTSLYPYFFGKVSSAGAAPGDNRPVANQALIDAGTKVVGNSSGTISINFNSGSDDYIWFAIPATMASKTKWFVNTLNNGSIGGALSPGGNLFPAFDTEDIDSPTVLWAGIPYKIYVSNYQSAVTAPMELRNA